jgi:hypothetical protein
MASYSRLREKHFVYFFASCVIHLTGSRLWAASYSWLP